jgi:hypothetical protein
MIKDATWPEIVRWSSEPALLSMLRSESIVANGSTLGRSITCGGSWKDPMS